MGRIESFSIVLGLVGVCVERDVKKEACVYVTLFVRSLCWYSFCRG